MNHVPINCADFLAEMSNLLDDQVDAGLRAHLVAHLAECKTCSVLYDSTRKTISILTDTEAFELPASDVKISTKGIMARIREMGMGPS